eukprot:1159036-Pelagomonas_calceolata.AAC.5
MNSEEARSAASCTSRTAWDKHTPRPVTRAGSCGLKASGMHCDSRPSTSSPTCSVQARMRAGGMCCESKPYTSRPEWADGVRCKSKLYTSRPEWADGVRCESRLYTSRPEWADGVRCESRLHTSRPEWADGVRCESRLYTSRLNATIVGEDFSLAAVMEQARRRQRGSTSQASTRSRCPMHQPLSSSSKLTQQPPGT